VTLRRHRRVSSHGSIPITDGDTLVGMINDRDITTRVVAEAADLAMASVGDVYSQDLRRAQADIALTFSEDEKKTGELVEAIFERSEGERR
jgi:CBS domain-containing protein